MRDSIEILRIVKKVNKSKNDYIVCLPFVCNRDSGIITSVGVVFRLFWRFLLFFFLRDVACSGRSL